MRVDFLILSSLIGFLPMSLSRAESSPDPRKHFIEISDFRGATNPLQFFTEDWVLRESGWKKSFERSPLTYYRKGSRISLIKKTKDPICRSILRAVTESEVLFHQTAALFSMLQIDYISVDQVFELLDLTKKLNKNQIEYFRLWRGVPFADYPYPKYQKLSKEFRAQSDGMLWTVRNYDEAGKANAHSIPSEFSAPGDQGHLKTFLETQGCTHAREYGRLWTRNRDAADKMLGFASKRFADELSTLGVSLKSGCAVFHALDEIHTRAYRLRHPDHIFPKGCTENCLFIVPLNEMLQYPH